MSDVSASGSSSIRTAPRVELVDVRLWLPVVAALLLINMFGPHQVLGTWCAAAVSLLYGMSLLRRIGVISVGGVIILITVLYGIAPAYDIFSEWGVSKIDETTYIEAFMPILLVYVAAIGTAYWIAVRVPAKLDETRKRSGSSSENVLAIELRYLLLLLLAIAYFAMATAQYGLTTGELSRAEIYQGENLGLRVIRAGVIFGAMYGFMGLIESQTNNARKWRMWLMWISAIGAYLYVDLMILGDRRIFLSAALAMLVAANPRPKTIVWLVIVSGPLVAFLWTFSFLRGVPLDSWLEIYDELNWSLVINLANGEFGGWTRIANDLLSAPFSEMHQVTVASAPVSLIPGSIYPDRPMAPSIWYVNKFDPATADVGGGWGFVLPLEGYLNAWYVGACLFGLLVGGAAGRLASLGGMWKMLATFVFAFSFRSDLVSLLQQGILTAAFAVVYRPLRFLQLFR